MKEPSSALIIHRLKKRAAFLRVAQTEKKAVTSNFVLQSMDSPEGALAGALELRVGFTASKKVGNAVMRNRAKRRLRAAVNELFPRYALAGKDYVLIARKNCLVSRYADILKDLRYALKKTAS